MIQKMDDGEAFAASHGYQIEEFTMSHRSKGKLLFLAAAGASFVLSVSLWFGVDREQGQFVGLWVPSILALGALVMSEKRGSS
jgi:hypothetical protein